MSPTLDEQRAQAELRIKAIKHLERLDPALRDELKAVLLAESDGARGASKSTAKPAGRLIEKWTCPACVREGIDPPKTLSARTPTLHYKNVHKGKDLPDPWPPEKPGKMLPPR